MANPSKCPKCGSYYLKHHKTHEGAEMRHSMHTLHHNGVGVLASAILGFAFGALSKVAHPEWECGSCGNKFNNWGL